MNGKFEEDNQNNMFILSMIDNANSVLVVSFFFFPNRLPNLIFTCPEIAFDSFVLQLCIDKHDTDKTTVF